METVGGLEPDMIVQRGIRVLQEKMATVIKELNGHEGVDGDFGGAQSPTLNGGFGGADAGYTTPGYGGGASVWGNGNAGGAGGTTPYGATPYGGQPSW